MGWVAGLIAACFRRGETPTGLWPALAGAVMTLCLPPVLGLAEGGEAVALASLLLALSIVDLSEFRLPDVLTFSLVGLGGLAAALGAGGAQGALAVRIAALGASLGSAGAGAGALWAIRLAFRRLRGKEGLGLGDVKLAAGAGAWLGLAGLPAAVLIACGLSFLLVGVAWARTGAAAFTRPVAFGAALSMAIWLVWCLRLWGWALI